ncbi:hypothetical protein H6G20_20890 [Desertifilum sp. FACHB-1129]|uniref:DUF2059 domain-containing protein n=2 Tax=Desertifilum tharense IPPAS B-1220 TaxID=1781255 RepID=A0A1E5QG89_9CYAN|nr:MULTISPECIES: hypothetical protein [Desertifilum]MDA0213648.1 hypothetical protein [Cyanobacteria bacterium FC1]MBD2314129.1 hypothetical protein [Desertifilum sp. FACHB-1129]MBD2323615.1 hypothetical protein [Desertifilum sp. FACHB-866]MBD2335067.1 hypothetical protein [Desertifilum sp. FACHB-868]OEJ73594.1 hypothetical protein BH720_19025 [Desertifilum tharense IPPAS B-1220]
MKRHLLALVACLTIVLNLITSGIAYAQPFTAIALPGFKDIHLTEEQTELVHQLESQLVPQLETILTPEQRESFQEKIQEGSSLRQAFKSMTLSPDQKSQLALAFKSLPKKDIFATLSPEQKKELFLKKKEMFIPTAEEISEKISESMSKKGDFAPLPEEVKAKISEGLKKREMFMPSAEEIVEKISEKMKAVTEQD